MGNSQISSRQSAEYESACRQFSQLELEALRKLYVSLAAQSRSQGKFVSASAFQAYFGIHGSLGARLFDLVTKMRKDQCLYWEDLVIAKAAYEKGSPDEIESFMFQLLDLTGDGKVRRIELEAVMLSILQTALGPMDASEETIDLQAFLNAADFSELSDKGERCMSRQDFRKLCILIPSVKKFLSSLLAPPSSPAIVAARQVPTLVVPVGAESRTLLRKETAWHIGGPLQQQEAHEWTLLYHSSINGLSFNSFLDNVSHVRGPTILVIKDMEGCVYGGYASQPWEKQSDFYGDMKSFLFTLHPQISLYRPTGSNYNLQWCAAHYLSESIPNGIGFGGQTHHFGLFLSAGFDQGHTRYSVTFNNPALSTRETVIPDTIECWAVVVKGADDGPSQDGSSKVKGTILERFKEDRQMLNMVGMANASASVD